jgi:putative SOS response-associated peptidase YedK
MAGIYQERDGKNCYCILTTKANDSVRDVHLRMPVVLTPELINTWIMEPVACRELLKKIPPQLLATTEDSQTSLW